MNQHVSPPIRPQYHRALAPFVETPIERALPLATRLWEQGWLRKAVIIALLALAWEGLARWQDNDLLLPSSLATMKALAEGLASGELLERVRISLTVLAQGYLAGIALAFSDLNWQTSLNVTTHGLSVGYFAACAGKGALANLSSIPAYATGLLFDLLRHLVALVGSVMSDVRSLLGPRAT